MAELGLRPLSLGEILDRTFSLYRRHFLLFIGITGLPHLMILALNLVQVLLVKTPGIVLKPPAGAQLQTAQRSIKLLCYGTQEVLTNPGVLPRPGSLYTHASA